MGKRASSAFAGLLSVALLAAGPAFAGVPGYFGLGLSADGEGFFLNPTLKTIKVMSVEPNSPAAVAGISAGDFIVEVEGKAVAGSKGSELKPYGRNDAGQTIKFVVKKPSGELVPITLIAAPKPEKRS